MHNYQELKIWKESRKLVKEVYHLTCHFPIEEKDGLTSRIRKSAVSIPSNIAEGTRRTDKDLCRFLDYAIGSLFELETQLILANDLNCIKIEDYEKINQNIKVLAPKRIKFKSILKV